MPPVAIGGQVGGEDSAIHRHDWPHDVAVQVFIVAGRPRVGPWLDGCRSESPALVRMGRNKVR